MFESQQIMAAKMKKDGNGKGKRLMSATNPPKLDVSQGIPTPVQKPIPNYLKPTICSSNEVCKCSRHASQHATSNNLSGMKSPIKPPSTSSIGKKALPGKPREKSLQPTSTSTSTKTTVSMKPVSTRTPMSVKNGQNQSWVKAEIARKEAIAKERGETKASRKNITSPRVIEKPASAPHQQEKEEEDDEALIETVKKEVVEHSPLDIPPSEDESLCQTLPSEAGDSTVSFEEHEEAPATKEIPDKKGDNAEEKNHHSEEHGELTDDDIDGDEEQHTIGNSISSKLGEDDPDEEQRTNGRRVFSTDRAGVANPPKPEFRRGKLINNEEPGGAERARLKFKERGNVGFVAEDLKQGTISVVLNHQEVQEKKGEAASNDVIEQTASKLVEERRSKVSALVGAFETVISLQG